MCTTLWFVQIFLLFLSSCTVLPKQFLTSSFFFLQLFFEIFTHSENILQGYDYLHIVLTGQFLCIWDALKNVVSFLSNCTEKDAGLVNQSSLQQMRKANATAPLRAKFDVL